MSSQDVNEKSYLLPIIPYFDYVTYNTVFMV